MHEVNEETLLYYKRILQRIMYRSGEQQKHLSLGVYVTVPCNKAMIYQTVFLHSDLIILDNMYFDIRFLNADRHTDIWHFMALTNSIRFLLVVVLRKYVNMNENIYKTP